jgi:transcriptional regulator GlxA family with amidase domain
MTRHRVVVLALDDVLPLDLGIPLQIFGRDDPDSYEVTTCSPGGVPVSAAGGISIAVSRGLEALESADTVIVPGYGTRSWRIDTETVAALVAAHRRGARMVSICSGTFALAQTGILDGLRVTTHWARAAELAEHFPRIDVEPKALFVDEGQVLTSAGVAAGIDLCLYIIRLDLGATVANRVARRIVAAPRREGEQAQFIEYSPVTEGGDPLAATREWMLQRLDEPMTVSHMAAHARLSLRGFSRHFAQQTGTAPLRWLHGQRVELAKELLESSALPIEEVASRVGLGSAANFRAHFKRSTSLAPQQYRRQFSRAAPSLQD